MRQGLRSEHLIYYLKYVSLLPIGRVHQRIFNHGNSVSRFKIVKNYSDKNVDERMEVDNIYYTIFSLCNTCIILYWASQLALVVKNPDVNSRGIRDMGLIPGLPQEEGMTTHSSILAERIPWTEEPGGLQSIGSQRVRQD